jgi:hypothetical protein
MVKSDNPFPGTLNPATLNPAALNPAISNADPSDAPLDLALEDDPQPDAFALKDCAQIAIATGRKAETLKELHDRLLIVTPDSIYHHFFGGLLEPVFEEREYNNDFAAWARRGLHDDTLAERLAAIDPTRHTDIEQLRQELLDILEERLEERDYSYWAIATEPFEFIRSQIVVFDTGKRIRHPEELAELMPQLPVGSIFYHFIDARRRSPDSLDDFRVWLAGFDAQYAELTAQLANIDPYFESLITLRQQLTAIFRLCCTQEAVAGGSP